MSDVFDEYAKIMEESGLLNKETGLEKTAEEKSTRVDLMDYPDYSLLYGFDPNGKKDKKSIIEEAHPESCIIAPAYDVVNGLVENEQERHNIMVDIVNKPTRGQLTQKRYVKAHEELINEIAKLAYLLDSKNDEELMKIADECLEKCSLKKKAIVWAPIIWFGVKALATALVAAPAISKFIGSKQGVLQDSERFLNEVTDLTNKPTVRFFYNWEADIAPQLQQMIESVQAIYDATKTIHAFHNDASTGMIEDDKKNFLLKHDAFLNRYQEAAAQLQKEIPGYLEILNRLKKEHEKSSHSFWQVMKTIKEYFSQSDWDDIIEALSDLGSSLSTVPDYVKAFKDELRNVVKEQKVSSVKELLEKETTPEELEKAKTTAPSDIPAEKSPDKPKSSVISTLFE